MIVYQLTSEQAEQIRGKEYSLGLFFDPPKDADGNYYISAQETEFCEFKNLPEIEYKPLKYKP